MPFIASNGLTEAGTSKTIEVGGLPGGINVHYHDVGEGEPVLFLHSYGPGTTAWITFHKAVADLLQQHLLPRRFGRRRRRRLLLPGQPVDLLDQDEDRERD